MRVFFKHGDDNVEAIGSVVFDVENCRLGWKQRVDGRGVEERNRPTHDEEEDEEHG